MQSDINTPRDRDRSTTTGIGEKPKRRPACGPQETGSRGNLFLRLVAVSPRPNRNASEPDSPEPSPS